MRTAIDANVVSAIWGDEPRSSEMIELLETAELEGGLVICGAVFAELLAYPGASMKTVSDFLADNRVIAEFEMTQEIWIATGNAYASYANRRRKSAGGEPKRLLVDFIVGTHASIRADRLLTLDRSRYARGFPDLQLLG